MFHVAWQNFFHDRRLRELIAAGLEQNRDLRLALLSIEEARAQYGVQRADRLPQIGVEGSDTYQRDFITKKDNPYETYKVMSVSTFEVDIFGRLKSLSDAALRRYLATGEAAKAVRISLISQVAQSYLAERLAAELLDLASRTLESRRTTFAFMERRVLSGQSSLLDMEQARGLVEAASAEVAARKDALVRAENALKLLLGSFDRQNLPPPIPLQEQRFAELPQGLPSTLLLRRPDIMESEYALRAANADIGAARSAFFPSISLTGNLGYVSVELVELFSANTGFWSFLPRINLPIFSGRRNTAELNLAEIRKKRAVVEYEQRIQRAFRETADALLTMTSLAEKLAAQRSWLQSQQLVLRLAMRNYTSGGTNYLAVLDAQRNVFEAERELLATRQSQLANDVSLYAALGGGLDVTDTGPDDANTESRNGSATSNQQ
jgi:Cu(I)/Ag(I) efflux system outer membrane protein